MERLIKDGDIILNGTKPRCEVEKEAFRKLEEIEDMLNDFEIIDLCELHMVLFHYWQILHIKNVAKETQKTRDSLYGKSENKE